MGRVVAVAAAAAIAAAACAAAGVVVAQRLRARARWRRAVAVVEEFEDACDTPVARLRQVFSAMVTEMHAGLASDGGSKLKMLLTYVDKLPQGSEEGTCYALDLGGTNFRVLNVQIDKDGQIIMKKVERHVVPKELTSGTSEDLFNYIASTLKSFVERGNGLKQSSDERQALGFTFSFPVRQISVSSGKLIKWTKEFAIEDAVNKDVADLLNEAIAKCGLDMRVAALVNDTVGTLALGHYSDQDTVAAVIIGTGTNACYIERTDALIKCQGSLPNSGGMVVNMEWGNFWTAHLPRTPFDYSLDYESLNRQEQGFEKMISGMYLGEIARLVICKMAQESDIFGDSSHKLNQQFILRTPLLAEMRADESPDLREVKRIFEEEFQIPDIPLKTRRLVVKVCDIVTRRAARLTAAGIVAILSKIGRVGSITVPGSRIRIPPRRAVVAVEGALYEQYEVFREYLGEAIVEILGEEDAQHVLLRVSEDGPGVGAALLAAVYGKGQGSI